MNMNDLIEKIGRLEKQLVEKEHELHLLKEDLEAIRTALEAAIEQESIPEKEELKLAEEVQEVEIPEEDIADSEVEEEAVKEEPALEKISEEQQHEAIMRTIEEFSKEQRAAAKVPETESITLADRVSGRPLSDIKKAIGINERFLFANVLFNGDMAAFSKAVEELNHLESKEDAVRLMDEELSLKYKWEEEDQTVMAFKTLVSRRFS